MAINDESYFEFSFSNKLKICNNFFHPFEKRIYSPPDPDSTPDSHLNFDFLGIL